LRLSSPASPPRRGELVAEERDDAQITDLAMVERYGETPGPRVEVREVA
jgi:hypothetical protein